MIAKTSLVIGIALMAATSTASAQVPCGSRDVLIKQLAAEYQETPVGIGLASNGSVIELLASADGTWTLLVTTPTGMTCLMEVGEAWQPIIRKVSLGTES